MQNYYDIYFQQGENPVFCYRSGLAVYEETFLNGSLVSSGYNAAGYPLNVLTNFPSRLNPIDFHEPSAFNIELDGQCIDYNLEFESYEISETENSKEAVIILKSNIKPVKVKIHTLLDGTQMFSRYIEIENLSDKNICLSRLSLLSGGVEETDRSRYSVKNDINKIYSVG
ncbi:MAG: hypothetical protein U0L11_01850, partial [Acutalibacteraceae bacterium]|nr:hypothetical protein [Acutalibacteraceae bacterium]